MSHTTQVNMSGQDGSIYLRFSCPICRRVAALGNSIKCPECDVEYKFVKFTNASIDDSVELPKPRGLWRRGA